jgi:putative copper resistance protein D
MTDGPVIAIRFALYLCLALLFGLPLFRLHALSAGERADLPQDSVSRTIMLIAIAAIALALSGLWLNCARMADMTVMALDVQTVQMIVTQTQIGMAWQVQLAALVISLLAALWWHRSDSIWTVVLIAGATGTALAALAWTGHGAAGDGLAGSAHLIADIIHLLAMGLWLGALAAFVGLLFGRAPRSPNGLAITAHALRRFAITGSIAVAAIMLSGVVNGLMLMDIANPGAIIGSLYGRLLVAKLVLFAGMVALAAVNRFRLTPSLAQTMIGSDPGAALAALRRSLAVESGTALAILALVAWLGTLAPPGLAN